MARRVDLLAEFATKWAIVLVERIDVSEADSAKDALTKAHRTDGCVELVVLALEIDT